MERSLIDPVPGVLFIIAEGISEQGIKYVSGGIIKKYDSSGLLHIEKYVYPNPERSFLIPFEPKIKAVSKSNGYYMYLRQGPYPENRGIDWEWYYEAVVGTWPKVLLALKNF